MNVEICNCLPLLLSLLCQKFNMQILCEYIVLMATLNLFGEQIFVLNGGEAPLRHNILC